MAHRGDDELAEELASANRVLAGLGVVDAFGHISVRSQEQPECFLISVNKAPATIDAGDIVRAGPDGEVIGERASYLERYLHSAIYASRPDVHSIVHSHAPAVIPFTVTSAELRPVMHVSGFLRAGAPRFEIRDVAGPASDLLVSTPELGSALAQSLGDSALVLMRGHGFVTVASSIRMAVFQAFYAIQNARVQLDSIPLGSARYLSEGECRQTAAAMESQVDRAWNVWLSEFTHRGVFAPADPVPATRGAAAAPA